jgi:NADH-quinone oxidoreductase subunit M
VSEGGFGLLAEPLALAMMVPLLGAVMLLLAAGTLSSLGSAGTRRIALAVGIVEAVLCVVLVAGMVVEPELTRSLHVKWSSASLFDFRLRLDGIGAPFLLLAALVFPLALCGPWPARGSATLGAGLLALQSSLVGLALADDVLLFAACWTTMTLTLCWLLGPSQGWRFSAPALIGSALVVFAALELVVAFNEGSEGQWTSDFGGLSALVVPGTQDAALAGVTGVAAAVLLGVLPFHGWTQRAIAQGRSPVAIFALSGARMFGLLLLLRWTLPLHAGAFFDGIDVVAGLAFVTVIHGALLARADRSAARLMSGVALVQVGLVLIGVTSGSVAGLMGAASLALGHGISMAGVLVGVGAAREAGASSFSQIRGLRTGAPRFARRWSATALASTAFPASLSFVGVLGVLAGVLDQGSSSDGGTALRLAILVGTVALAGAALLRNVLRTLGGRRSSRVLITPFRDRWAQRALLVSMSLCLLGGLWSNQLSTRMHPSLDALQTQIERSRCRAQTVARSRPMVLSVVPGCDEQSAGSQTRATPTPTTNASEGELP